MAYECGKGGSCTCIILTAAPEWVDGVTDSQLTDVPFIQIGAYGAVDRDPRGRVVTVAFLTLVPSDRVDLVAGSDASKARCFPLDELPELPFDHATILADARTHLSDLVGTEIDQNANAIFSFLPNELEAKPWTKEIFANGFCQMGFD